MSIDVTIKIGNLNNGPDVGRGALDLTPIDWHEEGVIDDKKDQGTLEKFGVITLDDCCKPFIMEAVKERNACLDDTCQDHTYRNRCKFLDLNYFLSKMLGGSDLYHLWKAKNQYIPKIDARHITDMSKLFKDISCKDLSEVREDLNSVSSGSHNVGSGGDYATFALAAADTANLSGDITFTQISDITETSTASWTEFIFGHTCTITSDIDPLGSPISAYDLNINHTSGGMSLTFSSGSGTVIVEKLLFKHINGSAAHQWFLRSNNSGNTLNWRDLMFDGQSNSCYTFFSNNATASSKFYNFIAWDCGSTVVPALTMQRNNWLIENGFVYNCDAGFDGNSKTGITVRNVYIADSTNNDFQEVTTMTGENNASSDTTAANGNWSTGTDNLTSLTTASEIKSTDDTNVNFAKPVYLSNVADGGKTPTSSSNDIAGLPWDAITPSIGAFEVEIPQTGGQLQWLMKRKIHQSFLAR